MSQNRKTLYVGDISKQCTEQDIVRHFSQIGEIEHIRMNNNPNSSLSYAFIKYHRSKHARLAYKLLNGSMLKGKTIRYRYYIVKWKEMLLSKPHS